MREIGLNRTRETERGWRERGKRAHEEAIVKFIKQHEELYDKKQVQRQPEERKTLRDTSSYKELTCQHCQEVVRDSEEVTTSR